MPLNPSHSGRAKKDQNQNSINYSHVTVVQQGPEENPLTFLQHLKDAIRKHTTGDPESQMREGLLKNKFLTQSAPDIHKQLSLSDGKKLLNRDLSNRRGKR
jgi:hypothetical protein